MSQPTDITVIQHAAVTDRLADLAREGAALRAERNRDHLREHAAAPDEELTHPVDLPSQRVRLGRWLVAIGEAIAFLERDESARPARLDRSSEERPDGLQPAA